MAYIEKKFLKGVGKAFVIDTVNGTPVSIPIFDLKNISIESELSDTEQTGGDGIFPLDSFITANNTTVKMQMATVKGAFFELMGLDKDEQAQTDIKTFERSKPDLSDAISTKHSYKAGTVRAYDAHTGKELSVSETGEKEIEVDPAPDAVDVVYDRVVNSVTSYDMLIESRPIYFELIHTSERNDCREKQQITIYKLKISGPVNIVQGEEGEYTSPEITAKVLDPGRGDKKILRIEMWSE
jgi:hypothetical protein